MCENRGQFPEQLGFPGVVAGGGIRQVKPSRGGLAVTQTQPGRGWERARLGAQVCGILKRGHGDA